MRLCLITHEFNVVDHLFNITLVELSCKDRESRMYFMSMEGVCDVRVGEKGRGIGTGDRIG